MKLGLENEPENVPISRFLQLKFPYPRGLSANPKPIESSQLPVICDKLASSTPNSRQLDTKGTTVILQKKMRALNVTLRNLRTWNPNIKKSVEIHPTSNTFPHLSPYYPLGTLLTPHPSTQSPNSPYNINGSVTSENIRQLKKTQNHPQQQQPEDNDRVYPFLCPKTNRLYLSPIEYRFTPKSANRRNLTIHDVQPNLHKLPKGFHPFYTDLTQLP